MLKEHRMNMDGYKVPVWSTPGNGLATLLGAGSGFRFLRRPDDSEHLVGEIVPDGTPLTPENTQARTATAELFAD